jgi:hypothetical protein
MKKYPVVFLLVLIMVMMFLLPVAMAEAADPVPGDLPFNPASPVQILDGQVLTTFGGMVALTMMLAEGIKRVFMKNIGVDAARIMVFIVAVVVVAVAKLIGPNPLAPADIILLPGNAVGVWLSATKLYEKIFGTAGTPAGSAAKLKE